MEISNKHPFFEVCRTPELACEVTLQVMYYWFTCKSLNPYEFHLLHHYLWDEVYIVRLINHYDISSPLSWFANVI